MSSVSGGGVAAASGPWAVLTPPAFGFPSVLHPGSSKSLLTAQPLPDRRLLVRQHPYLTRGFVGQTLEGASVITGSLVC